MAAKRKSAPPGRRRQVSFWLTALAAAIFAAGAVAALASGEYFISPVRTALYIAAPLLLAALCIPFLFFGRSARIQFVIYGVAAIAAVVAADVYVQTSGLLEPAAPAQRNAPQAALVPHVCPGSIRHLYVPGARAAAVSIGGAALLPLTGISDNLLSGKRLPDGAPWRTDRYGFNNPPGQWTTEPGAILVLGDSFAFGADAPPGRGFADQLRGMLGRTVNLGCGGNGPLAELGALVEYGALVKPRYVIWAYYEGNDLTKDLPGEWEIPPLRRYLEPGFRQNLSGQQTAIDQGLKDFIARQRAAARTDGPAERSGPGIDWRAAVSLTYLRSALGLTYGYRRQSLARFEAVLRRARSMAGSLGGTLIFVYLPGQTRYRSAISRWDADGYKRAVLAMARRLDIPVVDVDAVFRRRGDPSKLFAGHYTVEGYGLVARAIAAKIRALGR